jgi:hypothetical protein
VDVRLPFAESLGGGYIGRVRAAVATSLLLAALALGACGDDESTTGVQVVPAAGQYAQTDDSTPGVPAGSSYDITAREYLDLSDADRLTAATDYVAADRDACGGALPAKVRDYADVSAGADYPLTSPVAELLAEGCAAAEQSGPQDSSQPTG